MRARLGIEFAMTGRAQARLRRIMLLQVVMGKGEAARNMGRREVVSEYLCQAHVLSPILHLYPQHTWAITIAICQYIHPVAVSIRYTCSVSSTLLEFFSTLAL
jgi:hypothetical protein